MIDYSSLNKEQCVQILHDQKKEVERLLRKCFVRSDQIRRIEKIIDLIEERMKRINKYEMV